MITSRTLKRTKQQQRCTGEEVIEINSLISVLDNVFMWPFLFCQTGAELFSFFFPFLVVRRPEKLDTACHQSLWKHHIKLIVNLGHLQWETLSLDVPRGSIQCFFQIDKILVEISPELYFLACPPGPDPINS